MLEGQAVGDCFHLILEVKLVSNQIRTASCPRNLKQPSNRVKPCHLRLASNSLHCLLLLPIVFLLLLTATSSSFTRCNTKWCSDQASS